MLTAYIEAAMRYAVYRQYDDGTYFGSIEVPGFEGVWANEATEGETQKDLRNTLEDWLLLGLRLHHHLPVVDDIDLNTPVAA